MSVSSPVCLSVKAVLCDIIGTTTPFSFLSETIHGLMRREFSGMLASRWDMCDVQDCVRSMLQAENDPPVDADGKLDRSVLAEVTVMANEQMSSKKESPHLKRLQGIFLKDFYADGSLTGIVFDDVEDAFKRWKSDSLGLLIYSSGSTKAQRLLFHHATAGSSSRELDRYIDAYFDTAVGSKSNPVSYSAICHEMDLEPHTVVFIADMIEEVEAAHAAGLQVVVANRPGNLPLDMERAKIAPIVSSFDDLRLVLDGSDGDF